VELIRDKYDDLGGWPPPGKLPVLYNACYNIGFWGLEKLHPFDSKKFQRVLAILEEGGVLSAEQFVEAREAGPEVLREVHTQRYLNKLDSSSFKVAQVSEGGRGHWATSLFQCALDLLPCEADQQSWHARGTWGCKSSSSTPTSPLSCFAGDGAAPAALPAALPAAPQGAAPHGHNGWWHHAGSSLCYGARVGHQLGGRHAPRGTRCGRRLVPVC
jgi:acetoin utilization deacetylase AcuC-like enzyme